MLSLIRTVTTRVFSSAVNDGQYSSFFELILSPRFTGLKGTGLLTELIAKFALHVHAAGGGVGNSGVPVTPLTPPAGHLSTVIKGE